MTKYIALLLPLVLLFSACGSKGEESSNSSNQTNKAVQFEISKQYVRAESTFYIDEQSVLWGYGSNNCGQLGNGKIEDDFFYYQVDAAVKIAENVKHISVGRDFIVYITNDGVMFGVGSNKYGVLCAPLNMNQRADAKSYGVSTPVLLLDDVQYAVAGSDHVLALKSDASLWAWGSNMNGQIGDGQVTAPNNRFDSGTSPCVYTPTHIMDDVIFVAGTEYNSAAITQDATLWTWGDNSRGQHGNGQSGNGLPTISNLIGSKPEKILDTVEMIWANRSYPPYEKSRYFVETPAFIQKNATMLFFAKEVNSDKILGWGGEAPPTPTILP